LHLHHLWVRHLLLQLKLPLLTARQGQASVVAIAAVVAVASGTAISIA
jgi:hypothetical protein